METQNSLGQTPMLRLVLEISWSLIISLLAQSPYIARIWVGKHYR